MQTIQKIDSTIINFINQPNIKNYINFYTTLITADDSIFVKLSENMSLFNTVEFLKQYKNQKLVGVTQIPEEIINETDELKDLVLYTFLAVSFFRHNTPTAGLQHTINSLCLNKSPAGKYSDIRWFLLGEIFKCKDNFNLLKIPQQWMTTHSNTPSPSYCYSQAILRNPYLIPAWQRLHDIFSVRFTKAQHYFPDFAASGLIDNTDSQAIQRFCSKSIKNIDPLASNSHYQFKVYLVRPSQFPAVFNNNAKQPTILANKSPNQFGAHPAAFFPLPATVNNKPSATSFVQPIDLPQAISDFIIKMNAMDPNQKLKSFVDQLKGDFQNLKLAIRNVHDLHYVSKCITRKDILLSFLSHFISHPSYVNDFRQFEKPCDTAFLKKILGNNKHDINNNINIIVQLLPVGGNTLKPQQVIRQRLEKETSQWKVSPLREPIRTIVPTVYAPANNQPVATIIIEEVQPMIMEIEGGEYEDEPVVQRAPVNREPIRTIVPTVYAPVNNQPVAAIIIEEVQPMIMEIEGGEYEDDPVVQGVPVNIETHQDIAPEVDAPPLTPIDLLSASGDSIDNDDCWTQSSAFHFFSSVKRKTNNQKEINLSLSSSTEYDEKSGKHLTTIHNKVTFHQEIDMDIEPKNTKRTRDTTNDDSESPNKRPKI